MRLLIAEDGLDLAEALTVFFEKNQFSVDTVHDGFAAYDYASTGEYDAIVLDVMMPKMDGVQVLQRLREEAARLIRESGWPGEFYTVAQAMARMEISSSEPLPSMTS